MELSINYSPQAARLVEEGKIFVERFKCPPWSGMIAAALALRPVAVHFDLDAGNRNLDNVDWEQIEDLLEETDTPYVNLHLAPSPEYHPGVPLDTPAGPAFDQVAESMLMDVQAVVARFGPERVIVENVPYRASQGNVLRPAAEPQVIQRVLEETDAGLLLDISHARIAAHYLGIEAKEYCSRLPVHRLRELHFTGLHQVEGKLQDHLSILESDWPMLAWVLEKIRAESWGSPWMLAFEYGGVGEIFSWRSDPQVMLEQVPKLYEMVKDVA